MCHHTVTMLRVPARPSRCPAECVLLLATTRIGGHDPYLAAVLRCATMYYMSQPLSVRLNDATLTRLGARARRVHLPPRTLAQLLGTGKDVWEVIAVVRDNDGDAAESARYLEIPLGLVQAAIAYYGAYTSEIDQQIEANEQEAAEAHAAYLAGQAALQR